MIFADMEIAEGAMRRGVAACICLGPSCWDSCSVLGLGNLGIPLNWAEVQI